MAFASRDEGMAPYLGLHPLLSLQQGAGGERERKEVLLQVREPGPRQGIGAGAARRRG